jgi:hypothetical protein
MVVSLPVRLSRMVTVPAPFVASHHFDIRVGSGENFSDRQTGIVPPQFGIDACLFHLMRDV